MPRPGLRNAPLNPCPACGNHFIHQTTCTNSKPGQPVIFKWPADSEDN